MTPATSMCAAVALSGSASTEGAAPPLRSRRTKWGASVARSRSTGVARAKEETTADVSSAIADMMHLGWFSRAGTPRPRHGFPARSRYAPPRGGPAMVDDKAGSIPKPDSDAPEGKWDKSALERFVKGEITLAELEGVDAESQNKLVHLGYRLLTSGKLEDARLLFEGL